MNAYQRKKMEERELGPPVKPSAWNMSQAMFAPTKYREPMEALLGDDGPIAKSLPGYQSRPVQVMMAEAIYRGLCEGKHVIIEAGCGCGKSLAGLVPAIHWVMEQGGAKANHRVLVSTAMKILQDQYTRKDLPFLEEHLGIAFEWCKRKGRSNYACEVRVGDVDRDRLAPEDRPLFDAIWSWMGETLEGDLAELPFEISQRTKLKKAVTIKGSKCRASKCPVFASCFYYISKDRAVNCEIIVVNHALLVLNALFNGMILPEYDAVIIDEAHKLEDIVRNNLAQELSLNNFMGLLDDAESLDLFSPEKLSELRAIGEVNLVAIENALLRLVKYPGKHRFTPGTLPELFCDCLTQLRDVVGQIYLAARRMADAGDGSGEGGARDLVQECEAMGGAIRSFVDQDPSYVMWGDRRTDKDGVDHVHLAQAPIKVASWMQANLLQRPCVFMSATLATAQGEEAFTPFKEALGIERGVIEVQVPSPFDYVSNTRYSLGYYPRGPAKPPQSQDEWADIVIPRVRLVLNMTKGGALVLFTSRAVMNRVHWALEQDNIDGRWLLLKQDEASKDQLIEQFKSGYHSVLCATSSFFEGVDIPGDMLRCVIIDKIPFPMPSDPIQEAIAESYGREAFRKHSIPHAVTHLKQGVGRLIRCESDRGLLVLLDPRMRSAGYAKQILLQLPGYSYAAEAKEIEEFMAGIELPEEPRAELAPPGLIDDIAQDALAPALDDLWVPANGWGGECDAF